MTASIVKPAGAAVYAPPVNAPVPVSAGFWTAADLHTLAAGYDSVAVGAAVTVTEAVVVNAAQPPPAAIVYVTVYVAGVLVLGVMAPVAPSIVRPAVDVKAPPDVPVKVTAWPVANVVQNGLPT